jgi:hypothetical protein
MTRIQPNQTVWRETLSARDGRPILAGIRGFTLAFRQKGLRTTYELPINLAYWEAIKLAAAERIRERMERRKRARQRGK